jgi:hypothetical protein
LGLAGRINVDVQASADLPEVRIDRTLFARAWNESEGSGTMVTFRRDADGT